MRKIGLSFPLLIGFVLFASRLSFAGSATFMIDSDRSEITLSGDVAGVTLREQGPGSLTTRFTGHIHTDLTPTTIAFPGSSLLDALTSGVWRPLPGGSDDPPTGAPADYGAQGTVFFGTARAAVRDLVLDLLSQPLPLADGRFDASHLVFAIPDNAPAVIDFNTGLLGHGQQPLTGVSTNRVATTAVLATDGDTQRITIPIDAEYKLSVLEDNDSTINLRGQLVATRPFLPVIYSVQIENATATVRAFGLPNQSYELSRTTDLQTWTAVPGADTNPDPALYEFSAPVTGAVQFFALDAGPATQGARLQP